MYNINSKSFHLRARVVFSFALVALMLVSSLSTPGFIASADAAFDTAYAKVSSLTPASVTASNTADVVSALSAYNAMSDKTGYDNAKALLDKLNIKATAYLTGTLKDDFSNQSYSNNLWNTYKKTRVIEDYNTNTAFRTAINTAFGETVGTTNYMGKTTIANIGGELKVSSVKYNANANYRIMTTKYEMNPDYYPQMEAKSVNGEFTVQKDSTGTVNYTDGMNVRLFFYKDATYSYYVQLTTENGASDASWGGGIWLSRFTNSFATTTGAKVSTPVAASYLGLSNPNTYIFKEADAQSGVAATNFISGRNSSNAYLSLQSAGVAVSGKHYYSFAFNANGTITFSLKDSADHTFTTAIPINAFTSDFSPSGFISTNAYAAVNAYAFASATALNTECVITYDNVGIEYKQSASQQATVFNVNHSKVLGYSADETTIPDDMTDSDVISQIDVALKDYALLSTDAQALLTTQKSNLDSLRSNLIASKYSHIISRGYFSESFENSSETASDWKLLTNWSTDPDTKIVQLNKTIDNVTTTENVLKLKTTLTWNDYYAAGINPRKMSLFSPSAVLWSSAASANKPLKYVDGEMCIRNSVNTGQIITYYYKDSSNFSYFHVYYDSGKVSVRNYSVVAGDWSSSSFQLLGNSLTNINLDEWVHFRLSYQDDGNVVLTMQSDDNVSVTWNSYFDVPSAEIGLYNVCAFGVTGDATIVYFYLDNISCYFDNASSVADSFRVQYSGALALDSARVAPYDIPTIEAARSAYALLDSDVQAHLAPEKAKLDVLGTAANAWNTTSDETIANSFRTYLQTATAEQSWNVLNRLTATQKSLLTTEKATLVTELKNLNTTDSEMKIAVLGDSNTYGSGLTDYSNQRFTTLMQTTLNAAGTGKTYTVDNYGIPGFRVLQQSNLAGSTDTTLQFMGHANWGLSHNTQYDAVILMLGTNDIGNVSSAGELGKDTFRKAYIRLVQSYLAVSSSPTVIVGISPVNYARLLTNGADDESTIAKIQIEVAELYGLPYVDIHAVASSWTTDEKTANYQSDKLHFTAAGHATFAKSFSDFLLSGEKVFETSSVKAFDFAHSETAQYAPKIISATIRRSTGDVNSLYQDLRFKSQVSAVIKTGTQIVEYGTIMMPYSYVTGGTFTLEDMVYDTTDNRIAVAKNMVADNSIAGQLYYANLGGIPQANVGTAIVARGYVKLSDGTVAYSDNTTNSGSLSDRKGVADGYACRSVISIAKAMATDLKTKSSIDTSSIIDNITNGVITWATGATDNYGEKILQFICNHAADIEALS